MRESAVVMGFMLLWGATDGAVVEAQRCRAGYEWNRRFAGCVQTDCNDVEHAHYAYGGECVCGSSGSIAERSTDPNQECSHGSNHSSCPGCVYACVVPGRACPGAPGAAPRDCNLDQEILDLERDSEELAQLGQRLRSLIEAELPTFPQLDYCVRSSGSSITVNINDGASAANQVLQVVGAVESVLDIGGAFQDGEAATLRSGLTSLSVGVLRSLRGQVIEARTRSRGGNDPALQFMRDTQQMAANVERVRERMVCSVRRGLPDFFQRTQALERTVEALERRIASDPQCAQGLSNLIAVKMRELQRIYRWHGEGVLRPPGTANSGFVRRGTWLDRRIDGRTQPQVFNEVRCP